MPFAALRGENLIANQKAVGKYLSQNNFDIVAVQEDFGYHKHLVKSLSGFKYMTNHTGGIPGGDELNIFTKNMPVYNEKRESRNEAGGILSDGSDKLTPKGFVYSVIDIGNGIYVDFYNIHADAYGGEGSVAARTSQYKQLAEFIQSRTAENDRPVIVTGDFNNYMHTHEDDGKAVSDHFSAECDFTFIKTEDFVENTQKLQTAEASENGFLRSLKWIFMDLIMIFSDLGNLPELLKELWHH